MPFYGKRSAQKLVLPSDVTLRVLFTDEVKSLGFNLTSTLDWGTHLTISIRAAYRCLAQLRQFFRQFLPQKRFIWLRKQIVQSLVLSRVQWFIGFLFPLSNRSIAVIKKFIKASAAAVLSKYVCSKDVHSIRWQMPNEWAFIHALQIIYRQRSIDLQLYSRSRRKCFLRMPSMNFHGTMLDSVVRGFNKLPETLRTELNTTNFIHLLNNHFIQLSNL